MVAAGLGDLHSLLGMCEIVEIAHSDNLCFQTPSPHRVKWTLLALRCREGHSSQGAPRKMAVPWAGECLPGADDFKKKKKSQPKSYVLEEESRKAEKSLSCWNCLVSICERLAGLLALTKIDGDHVAVNMGEGGRVPSFPTYMCVYIWVCIYYPISSAVACVTCASKLWRCGLSLEWGMRQGKCGCIYLWTYGGPGVTPRCLPLIEIGWLTSYCGHQEQPWGGAGRGGGQRCAWAQHSFQSMTGRNKHLPLLLLSPRMERGSCRDTLSRLSARNKSSTDTDNFWLLLYWISRVCSCMPECWLSSLHPHNVESELARMSWV